MPVAVGCAAPPPAHVGREDERYGFCVDAAEAAELNDDELIALIETRDDRGESDAALDELFRRIRAEVTPGERSSVEAAIARLKTILSHDDDDDGPDVGGVREPRRPPPEFHTSTAHPS